MKNRNRIFAILMSLAMLLGMLAFAIPAAADEPQASVPMANNTDVVLNGITFRFDPLGTHPNSKAEVNADGTITLTMREGDLFWIPSVTIDAQSELDMSVLMVSNNGGRNNCQMASGLAWKVGAGDNNAWGEDTDNTNILNLQTARRRRIVNGTVYQIAHGQITNVGVQAGKTDTNDKLTAFTQSGTNYVWKCDTVLRMKVYVKNDEGTDYVRGDICNADGEVLTYDYYALSTTAPKTMEGSVGYCVNWDGDGSDDGDMVITIQNFTVKDALINGTRGDFDLVSILENAELDVPAMSFAGTTTAEFYENNVELAFELGVDASIPETAELVVKRGTTEIARSALSTLEKGTNGYLWETELEGVETTETLTLSLEQGGVLVERSELTYALGAAYQAYLDSLGEPVASSSLNTVSYAEDFEGLNMTLVPGENIVNGQKWLYIRNSEDGSAVIKDGKLYFSGSHHDRILFVNQLYDHINFRYLLDVCYDSAPEVPVTENEETTGAYGYIGAAVNVPLELTDEKQNIGIAAFTPNYLYLKHAYFDESGVLHMQDEQGDLAVMPNDQRPSGAWSQYWQAVKAGETFMMRVFSGIADVASGNFGAIYADPATGSTKGGWGNNYSMTKSYRTGVIGLIAGEGQASATVDNIKVEVVGNKIKVDNEDFYIWGDGKVAVSALERSGEKLIYATVDGALKYAGDIVTANRKTQITTSQVTLTTRKTTADGETGLKWRTEISKADYDRLAADENVKSVELGTVVIPTANIAGGLTKETAGVTDIAAGSDWAATSDTAYTFEGVRTIAKVERDTSYSGVGYLKVTMKDDTVIVVYADYVTRNHAYALSDLVSAFHDNDDPTLGTDPANTQTSENNETAAPNETTEPVTSEEKGCKSAVLGAGAVLTVAILGGACVLIRRKENQE